MSTKQHRHCMVTTGKTRLFYLLTTDVQTFIPTSLKANVSVTSISELPAATECEVENDDDGDDKDESTLEASVVPVQQEHVTDDENGGDVFFGSFRCR
jgi:hypothetical protein